MWIRPVIMPRIHILKPMSNTQTLEIPTKRNVKSADIATGKGITGADAKNQSSVKYWDEGGAFNTIAVARLVREIATKSAKRGYNINVTSLAAAAAKRIKATVGKDMLTREEFYAVTDAANVLLFNLISDIENDTDGGFVNEDGSRCGYERESFSAEKINVNHKLEKVHLTKTATWRKLLDRVTEIDKLEEAIANKVASLRKLRERQNDSFDADKIDEMGLQILSGEEWLERSDSLLAKDGWKPVQDDAHYVNPSSRNYWEEFGNTIAE